MEIGKLSNLVIRALAPVECDEYWPKIYGFIEASCSYTPEELPPVVIRQMIEDAEAIAIIAQDGFSVVGVIVVELRDSCINCIAVGGDSPATWLQPVIKLCEEAAVIEGKESAIFRGRKAWQKIMGERGYELVGVIMRKRLQVNGRHQQTIE